MERPTGFEPVAYSFGDCRSIQLSYGRTFQKVIMTRMRFSIAVLAAVAPRERVGWMREEEVGSLKSEEIRNLQAEICNVLVRPEGLEPPAYRFEACRSIQLSYGRK